MPDPELKEWVSLIKDGLLALAALVTIGVGIYGARVWKRELIGKEVYAAARELVKQSHIASKAANKLRLPTDMLDKELDPKAAIATTNDEHWRMSEIRAYQKRIEGFSVTLEKFESAKLDLRVLKGSRVYEGFMPFGRHLTETILLVNEYLDLLKDDSLKMGPDSPEVLDLQQRLYPSRNLDDDLSQKLADSREEGENSLLAYLHRQSIHG